MKANICARRFVDVYKGWYNAYKNVMDALHEMGIEICISPHLNMQEIPPYATVGITDSPDDIYVYNHTHIDEIQQSGFFTGRKTLFIKPTLPTPNHFTLDSRGYAAASYITYTKPNFVDYNSSFFFEETVPNLIKNRPNKWSDRDWCKFGEEEQLNIPEEHILVLGQLPKDETCSRMSFGDHFTKLESIVDSISHLDNIVVKLHPHLLDPASEDDEDYLPEPRFREAVTRWENQGIVVLAGYTSLFDVLPKTKVAIVDNSTSGLECLFHQVPVISYGYPEYHWATKDLRHLVHLPRLVTDLSWVNQEYSNSFTAWYFEQYLCSDFSSTKRRLLEIFGE